MHLPTAASKRKSKERILGKATPHWFSCILFAIAAIASFGCLRNTAVINSYPQISERGVYSFGCILLLIWQTIRVYFTEIYITDKRLVVCFNQKIKKQIALKPETIVQLTQKHKLAKALKMTKLSYTSAFDQARRINIPALKFTEPISLVTTRLSRNLHVRM